MPSNPPSDKEALSGHQLLGYVAEMVLELRRLARTADFDFLGFLLDMAHEEACRQRQELDDADP